MLRRQTRTDILRLTIRKSLVLAADRRAAEDPRILDQLVRDSQIAGGPLQRRLRR